MGRRKHKMAFPAARIKRMMQSDEDVGKISTGTPVLVAKALEAVVEDLIHQSARVAFGRNAKTITPQHVRKVVESTESFDFLRSTFEKIPQLEDSQQPLMDYDAQPPSKRRQEGDLDPDTGTPRSLKRSRRPRKEIAPVALMESQSPRLPVSVGETSPVSARAPGSDVVRREAEAKSPVSNLADIKSSMNHLQGLSHTLPNLFPGNAGSHPTHDDDDDNYDEEGEDEQQGPSGTVSKQEQPAECQKEVRDLSDISRKLPCSVPAQHFPYAPADTRSNAERISVRALLS